MSPEQTHDALRGEPSTRLAAAESAYIAAVRSHEAVPEGIKHGAERLKAWNAIDAAKWGVINALWAKGELSAVVGLGEYMDNYFRALREPAAPSL